MNNVFPGNTAVEDRATTINFFNELDQMYNFTHGLTPLMIAISSSDQLRELTQIGLPFLDSYNGIINQCLNGSDCKHLSTEFKITGNVTILQKNYYSLFFKTLSALEICLHSRYAHFNQVPIGMYPVNLMYTLSMN